MRSSVPVSVRSLAGAGLLALLFGALPAPATAADAESAPVPDKKWSRIYHLPPEAIGANPVRAERPSIRYEGSQVRARSAPPQDSVDLGVPRHGEPPVRPRPAESERAP